MDNAILKTLDGLKKRIKELERSAKASSKIDEKIDDKIDRHRLNEYLEVLNSGCEKVRQQAKEIYDVVDDINSCMKCVLEYHKDGREFDIEPFEESFE